MALRQGLPQTIVKLASGAAQATASIYQLPIVVPKGTYLISGIISIVGTAALDGCYVGLQTTNGVPAAATTDVIYRNTAALVGATVALPSGAAATQSVTFNTVYSTASDTTIYLNVSARAAGQTWAAISSGLINQVTLTQLAF